MGGVVLVVEIVVAGAIKVLVDIWRGNGKGRRICLHSCSLPR